MVIDGRRKDRKKEHIEEYLKSSFKASTLFKDVYFEHNSLPELNLDEIDSWTKFLGKNIKGPIMINAMTGGSDYTLKLNRDLAKIAKQHGIAMAVGSQTIALRKKEGHKSFEIVREIMGNEGVVIANLNGYASLEEVRYALKLVDGDGIQIHLNPAQELVMEEGERNFRGILKNIENIVKNIDKPVIVKEVGFGMSKDVAEKLYNIGVSYIDIAGKGGSNFIEIEDRRNKDIDFKDMYPLGIPTAFSLIQCRTIAKELKIISSGGISSSLDILKSLILGADMVGIAGTLLRILVEDGYEEGDKYIRDLIYKLRLLMLLTGSKNIEDLKKVPYKVKGDLKDLLETASTSTAGTSTSSS